MTENEKVRLEKIQEKISQMKMQEQQILARSRERQRKARNRRLFQYGALVEKYLGGKGVELEDIERVLQKVAAKGIDD